MFRFFCGLLLPAAAVSAPLPQEVYVWQRAWTPPVRAAVAAHAADFSGAVVLAADVSWKNQSPRVARAEVDFPSLVRSRARVGLALRIGPYGGLLATNAAAVGFLADLAVGLVSAARAGRVDPVELQVDYDCATARLDDYRAWLEAVRRRVAPLPVTITALPAWLGSKSFPALAAASTNYVLQVHSLEKPSSLDAPFTLCDPGAARRAVAAAGKIGVPFRVALPTYGYTVAFDAAGRFSGIAAEAPRPGWPGGTRLREVRADPLAMAALVNAWGADRPAALRGVIWYRLPVAVDNLNWRWPTLAAILSARVPQEKVSAVARRVEPKLVEISLENTGELDISSRLAVEVRWAGARLVAGDALQGFELVEPEGSAAKFNNNNPSFRLPAGGKILVGWLRFDQENEVQLEVKK